MFPSDKSALADDSIEAVQHDFKPMSPEEAQAWRAKHVPLSPWRIVIWQAVAGGLAVVLTWLFAARSELALSVGYGALSVLLPAALLARALGRQSGVTAGAALVGFFVWELVKVALTVALLLLAPSVVPHLSWLALLAGFVVAMKVYWVAVWLHPMRHARRTNV